MNKARSVAIVGALAAAGTIGSMFLGAREAEAATTSLRFGYACQNTFNELPTVACCQAAHAFSDQLTNYATRMFNWNLEGDVGPRVFEDDFDHTSNIEQVDIAYLATHSGAWHWFGADFAGKNFTETGGGGTGGFGVEAYSKRMRLGDEQRGLSVLALNGCTAVAGAARGAGNGTTTPKYKVLEDYWTRWNGVFRGGLRIVLGNWDSQISNSTIGSLFGKYVKQGLPLGTAWYRADREGKNTNDTAWGSFGNGESDCNSRMDSMTLQAMDWFPRRRDGEISWWCRRWFSHDGINGD
jgi:hypothetical protein